MNMNEKSLGGVPFRNVWSPDFRPSADLGPGDMEELVRSSAKPMCLGTI